MLQSSSGNLLANYPTSLAENRPVDLVEVKNAMSHHKCDNEGHHRHDSQRKKHKRQNDAKGLRGSPRKDEKRATNDVKVSDIEKKSDSSSGESPRNEGTKFSSTTNSLC
ncbi:hypothetical protein COOONC_18143 [Cooperia oncophora]